MNIGGLSTDGPLHSGASEEVQRRAVHLTIVEHAPSTSYTPTSSSQHPNRQRSYSRKEFNSKIWFSVFSFWDFGLRTPHCLN